MSMRRDAGFSLFEMLIALAIIGVVFGLLSVVIGYGREIVGRSTADRASLDELSTAKRILTEALSQVVVSDRTGLSGSQTQFSMLAYGPQALGWSKPAETTFETAPDEGGLIASWRQAKLGQIVMRRIMSPGTEIRFAYFGHDGGWSPGWDETRPLPELVRVRLGLSVDDFTNDLIIPVKQLRPPSCLTAQPVGCQASR